MRTCVCVFEFFLVSRKLLRFCCVSPVCGNSTCGSCVCRCGAFWNLRSWRRGDKRKGKKIRKWLQRDRTLSHTISLFAASESPLGALGTLWQERPERRSGCRLVAGLTGLLARVMRDEDEYLQNKEGTLHLQKQRHEDKMKKKNKSLG